MKLLKHSVTIILLSFTLLLVNACRDTRVQQLTTYQTPFRNLKTDKVDSLVASMTIEQKIGQLCMLSYPQLSINQIENAVYLIKPAGIINTVADFASFNSHFPSWDTLNTIPLLKANSALQTFINRPSFPSELCLTAIRSDSLFGYFSDLQKNSLTNNNFHFNISSNLAYQTFTDVSGVPEYSTDPELQFFRFKIFNQKLQETRLLTGAHTLHHLPQNLPDTIRRVDTLNRFFKKAFLDGCSALLIDKNILSNCPEFPADSLGNYLSNHLSFDGLLLTKIPKEKIISTDHFLNLLNAGIDLFVFEKEPEKSFHTILEIVKSPGFDLKILDKKVQKILLAKSWAGVLDEEELQSKDTLHTGLTESEERWLEQSLFENSITLLRDSQALIPLHNDNLNSIYLLSIGEEKPQTFVNTAWRYASPSSQHIKTKGDGSILSINTKNLKRYGVVVIAINDFPLDTSLNSAFFDAYRDLNEKTKVIIVNFGQPGNLRYFEPSSSFLQLYATNELVENLAAQTLFGGIVAKGRSPVDIKPICSAGDGILGKKPTRLKYTIPEEVGIDPEKLKRIDSLALEAIYSGSVPGCQILLAKDGKVFYNKTFGYHTYSKRRKVKSTDLYDIASITKVAATTVSAMRLYDQGKYTINDSLYKYLPRPYETSIRNIKIRDFFIHESGLQPNMPVLPFLVYIDSTTGRYDTFYCWDDQQYFSVKIAEDFYMGDDYLDTMWTAVCQLPVDQSVGYQYSDVNFNIIQFLVEKTGGKPLDEYASENLYTPLGLRKMTFKPLEHFKPEEIIPTEEDDYWRMQLVHGYVHDESAALQGGVAGNAGLFSNAQDLAILFQMLLNKGSYGGQRFMSEGTVDLFSRAVHGNHRGLGFDSHSDSDATACAKAASIETFGHTGFTGTAVWADPKSGLLFVFLSNRVHPTRKNKGLYSRQIRERIHETVYDAFNSFELY